MGAQVLMFGDACPACGGDFKAARVPTDEQFKRAMDRENPVALMPGMDTATADARAQDGALYRCIECGYKTRFKDAPAADADGATTKKRK